MAGPGESIFLGSDSIHLNNSFQRQEEEEALQDQQRRNKELGNLLTNAFDDLCDDDDDDASSIVSNDSHHMSSFMSGGGDASLSEHYKHCYRTSLGMIGNQCLSPQTEEAIVSGKLPANVEQLQVLYEVRVREIQRLSADVEKWRRQSALNLAEKERLKMTLAQQANQLTASEIKMSDLQTEVATFKQNTVNAEKSKNSMARELQTVRMTSADLQNQLKIFQRGNLHENAFDTELRDLQQSHQREMHLLQDKLEATENNLALKTVEHDRLTTKLSEVTRDLESQLLAKSETIGQLSASLGATQLHVQQLQQQLHAGINTNDLNIKLKEELERCIAGSHMKIEDNNKLQEQLNRKEDTIKKLRDEEAKSFVEMNTFKDQAGQLLIECKRLQDKVTEYESLNAQLHGTNTSLQQQMRDLRMNQQQQQQQLQNTQAEPVVHETEKQMKQLKARLDAALAENDRVKESYVEVCSAKDQLLADLRAAREALTRNQGRQGVNNNNNKKEEESVDSESVLLGNEIRVLQSKVELSQHKIYELEEKLELEGQEKFKLLLRVNHMKQDGLQDFSSGELDLLECNQEEKKNKVQNRKGHNKKLEEELSKLRLEFKETEEMIKDQAMKVFADDFKSLQEKCDHAMMKWELCEKKQRESEQELDTLKANADRMTRITAAKVTELQEECNDKVNQLREAEMKFEQFQTGCIDEFVKLRNKYQKNLDKINNKYKLQKKTTEELKQYAESKDKHLVNECRRMEDGYRNALLELERRMKLLLQKKT